MLTKLCGHFGGCECLCVCYIEQMLELMLNAGQVGLSYRVSKSCNIWTTG